MKPGVSILLILLFYLMPGTFLSAQEVPHPVNNTGVYEFLDELASIKITEINSAVKPYSRLFIANRLQEADKKRDQLNPRQQKELDFYLRDFGKEMGREGEREEERGRGSREQRAEGRERQ